MATTWTLNNPAVASAIAGARVVDQQEGIERAAELHLDGEVMKELHRLVDINRGRPLRQGPARRQTRRIS